MPRLPTNRIPSLPLASPLIRRVAWHIRRVAGQLDRRFFLTLAEGILVFVAIAAVLITIFEKSLTLESFFDSVNWGIATVLGQGNSGFVTSPAGRVISWLLILFGVAMLGMITGALVAMVIDFLLKEGQGLGASGYKDHIVVCGWNATARDLIEELRGDDYQQKVVVLAQADKNPAGTGVYFVRGDTTNTDDLARAGIAEASAALIFPIDASDEADMHSILTIMAIESRGARRPDRRRGQQPAPRTALPAGRCRRAAGHLEARLAPAGALRAVSGAVRAGHRHRVRGRGLGALPDRPAGRVHRAPRSTRSRPGFGWTTAPRCCRSTAAGGPSSTRRATFRLEPGDDAIVVAESLGSLAPLEMRNATDPIGTAVGGAERLDARAA